MSKIQYGIQDLYIAKITGEDENGAPIYDTPFKFPGAVSLSVDPEGGEATPFYADNMVYYMSSATNNGYSGDLEVAKVIDKFLTDILGQVKDARGILFENSEATSSKFAMGFQAQGDSDNTRFWFYNCTANRPSRTHGTREESTEPATDTLAVTMNPRVNDKLVKAVCEYNTENAEIYNSWFNAVVLPTATV